MTNEDVQTSVVWTHAFATLQTAKRRPSQTILPDYKAKDDGCLGNSSVKPKAPAPPAPQSIAPPPELDPRLQAPSRVAKENRSKVIGLQAHGEVTFCGKPLARRTCPPPNLRFPNHVLCVLRPALTTCSVIKLEYNWTCQQYESIHYTEGRAFPCISVGPTVSGVLRLGLSHNRKLRGP